MESIGLRIALGVSLGAAATVLVGSADADAAPTKPNGLAQINATFGTACAPYDSGIRPGANNTLVDDAVSTWAHGSWSGNGSSIVVHAHAYLSVEINLVRSAVATGTGGDNRLDFGIGSYDCRVNRSNTSQWSTHSWGIAVDTNSSKNPRGQSTWNGHGYDGVDYKNNLPDYWRSNQPGYYVNFSWGIGYPTPDPMHFQYADGY
jgi:hypothetical protein